MKFETKNLPKSKVEIRFEVPAEEFDKYYENAILHLAGHLNLPGFRPGKVPKEVAEKEISSEHILDEAANAAINESYQKAIAENKIEAIAKPEVEVLKIAKGNPFEFKIIVQILPEISLPDYKAIASKVCKKEAKVEAKDIEEALEYLRKSRAKFTLKTEPSQKGDLVEITYSSPQIEGGQSVKDKFILGEGRLIPGFEDNIIGMSQSQEKEFSIPFPESHFQKELVGKQVTFKVKVESIQKMELPEMTDEWAKATGSFESLEALKTSINAGLTEEKIHQEKERRRIEIIEKIAKEVSVDVPDVLIEEEKNRLFENLKNNVQEQFGMGIEDYLKKIKKTEEELRNSFKDKALEQVKSFLILRTIGEKEKIEVTEKEILDKVNEFLKQYNTMEEVEKEIDLPKLKNYYENVIRTEKTFQILENCQVN